MKSLIRYVPGNVLIDLAAPLGPDARAIIERHYRDGSTPKSPYNRDNPAFICVLHEGGTSPGLFIKKIGGQWWAVHYESATGCRIRIPAPMSDEHKRQAEYWARAAEDAGYRAELECSLDTGTRTDVLIYGSVKTGIEVQCSPITARNAVSRTRKAAQASVTDVWYSGAAGATLAPRWAWRVPTVLSRELGIRGEGQSWDITPPRRSVSAAGLRTIRAAKCKFGEFDRCPEGRRHCGKYHPRPEWWGGLSVDDVAAMFPDQRIVPLRFWGVRMLGTRHREAVLLVPPASAALYTELTGRTGEVQFNPDREDSQARRETTRTPCQNQQPGILGQPVSSCAVCGLPLNPVLAQAGESTHPACDPDGLAARWTATSPGTCSVCLETFDAGQMIRQLPSRAMSGAAAAFGHDECVKQSWHCSSHGG